MGEGEFRSSAVRDFIDTIRVKMVTLTPEKTLKLSMSVLLTDVASFKMDFPHEIN